MKKLFFAVMLSCVMSSCVWADVEITAENFPYDEFRQFLTNYEAVEGNRDGWLSDSELAVMTRVSISNAEIKTLKGIEYFTELKVFRCNNDELTELDVSRNTKLVYLECSGNQITTLKLPSSLSTLNCYNRFVRSGILSELNLNGCNKLRILSCAANSLTELDLSDKTELVTLNCAHNMISELRLNNCTKLRDLNCQNNRLSELDVSDCTELVDLACTWNLLTELDISNNSRLVILYCADNSLTDINIIGNTQLRFAEIINNHIAAIDFNGLLPAWTELNISGQRVGHLVVKHQADVNPSYPYYVNLGSYMASEQINNISASSVKGYDEDNSEIDTIYSEGVARFSEEPTIVRYIYKTGFSDLSFDVAIMKNDYLSLSLNNHVYRVFTHGMRWAVAKEYCESLGGHLVTIQSDKELEVLAELSQRAHDVLGYYWAEFWVGGEKVGYGNTVNRWRWITGEEFTDTVSDDKAENIGAFSEKYISNLAVTTEAYLIAGYSAFPFGFICEWEPEATDFAPYSEEYLQYKANPDSYFEEGGFDGALPEPVDYSHLDANPPVFRDSGFFASELERAYDPRRLGTVSPVKDQTHNYRTCWAFAALGSLETSYVHQGFGTTAPDLSELHMAWYTYMDPRKDYRTEISPAYINDPVLNMGGDNTAAIAFLSRAGTASESDMPYERTAEIGALFSSDILPDTIP